MSESARQPLDAAAAIDLAEKALGAGREEEALPLLAAAAQRSGRDPRLWQWTGLLARSLGEHRVAIDAFARAARLAPAEPLLAHSRARVALEGGLESVALFERARTLAPGNAEVHLGLAAARCAAGDWKTALAELDALLASAPMWIAGHEAAARIRWMFGARDAYTITIERALAAQPRNPALWTTLLAQLMHASQYDAVLSAAERARHALGDHLVILANAAAAFSELARIDDADRLYDRFNDRGDILLAVRRVRHLLRSGRADEALAAAEPFFGRPDAAMIWPYVSLGWRLTDHPRCRWLEGDDAFVRTIDLPLLDGITALLRRLHVSGHQPLEQSLRGGTQTDGMLFQRIEPEIAAVCDKVRAAVAAHVAQLPRIDPAHPLLRHRRDRPPRFSGAWSVRLAGGGYHANHNHPAGWISAVLYVALPERTSDDPRDAGWLTLGEPEPQLRLGLGAVRTVEPKPGRLVLFPSTMWHGTRPFGAGERLTIAFDVAPPGPPG